jgi:hypothetical protein
VEVWRCGGVEVWRWRREGGGKEEGRRREGGRKEEGGTTLKVQEGKRRGNPKFSSR